MHAMKLKKPRTAVCLAGYSLMRLMHGSKVQTHRHVPLSVTKQANEFVDLKIDDAQTF